MSTTTIVGKLDLSDSIGTMLQCIQDESVEGALGDYVFAWKNGQHILIGTRQQEALSEESVLETTAFVFMSKEDGRQQRRPTTWNDLRALLAEGWVVGTDRKPGVKAWYPKTGRSIRRQLQDVYVFREPRNAAGGDSIHIGSISNNTGAIAIGRGARATVINQIVHGLGHLQTRHEASVRNFLDYYVGSSNSPEPFSGREPDLAAYTRWLDDTAAPPYALLTAPAGMGKSAVLAHWVLQIEQRRDVAVVFFPISERFETNSKSVVFSALFARLAFLHGDPPTRLFSAEEYRGAFQDYLARPLPDGRPLLVVLDGLDEASGWEVGAGLFPAQAPAHLKVMVAAREIAGDLDWATRLGWRVPTEAVSFGLKGLSKADLEEVLLRMGYPLAGLRANFDLVDKLYELTEHGDPLMIRLYVDALRRDKDTGPDFRPVDLLKIKPGLKRFFEFWFAQQENLWRASGDHIDRAAVDTLIQARATAYGPLTADDLDALAHDTFHGTSGVRRVAYALRRLLVGTGARGRGYSFSHPRLTQHFREQLSKREREDWQRQFLAYGASTLAELEGGGLNPEDAPEYVVRHYRLHLQEQADPTLSLCALMCKGWLQAWRALEGSEEGFLNDVGAAMDHSAKAGPGLLGAVIRGALCFASVRSSGSSFNADLLISAIDAGVLSNQVGLFLIRNIDEPHVRSQALLRIAQLAAPEQVELLHEALAAARESENAQQRAECLSAVAERLPIEEAKQVNEEALIAAREIQDARSRAAALSAVAEHLPNEEAKVVRDEAVMVAHAIDTEWKRAFALSAVAERLPIEEARAVQVEILALAPRIENEWWRADLLRRAAKWMPLDVLAVAREMQNGGARARALVAVATQLPLEEAQGLLDEALPLARELEYDGQLLVEMLCSVASGKTNKEVQALWEEALVVASGIQQETLRAGALRVMMKWLTADTARYLGDILTVARGISRGPDRVRALVSAARHLPVEAARGVLSEAFAAERGIWDEPERVEALSSVAEQLLEEEKRAVLSRALAMVKTVRDEEDRAKALRAVANRLPFNDPHLIDEALAVARGIRSKELRAKALDNVAQRLPASSAQPALREAFEAAREIDGELMRAEVFGALVNYFADDEVPEILGETLALGRQISFHLCRADLLLAVAQRAPADEAPLVLREALASVREIGVGEFRADRLLSVAEQLPTDEAQVLFAEAIVAARSSTILDWRVHLLISIAKHLPADEARTMLEELVIEAYTIETDSVRANALRMLTKALPTERAQVVIRDMLAIVKTLNDSEQLRILALQASEWKRLATAAQRSESSLLLQVIYPPPRVTRPNLLIGLGRLAPVIGSVGGENVLQELMMAITDTAEWWP